jgi:hypothetical protein
MIIELLRQHRICSGDFLHNGGETMFPNGERKILVLNGEKKSCQKFISSDGRIYHIKTKPANKKNSCWHSISLRKQESESTE